MQVEFGMFFWLTVAVNIAFICYISATLKRMRKRFSHDIMSEWSLLKKVEEETVIEKFGWFSFVSLINSLFFFDTFFSINFKEFIGFCIVTFCHLLLLLIFIATKEVLDRRPR